MKNNNWKRIYRIVCMIAVCTVLLSCAAFASETEAPIMPAVNAFNGMVRNIVTIAGGLVAILGAVQFGLSLQSHDPSQKSTGIMTFFGGLIIALAPQIIDWLTKM